MLEAGCGRRKFFVLPRTIDLYIASTVHRFMPVAFSSRLFPMSVRILEIRVERKIKSTAKMLKVPQNIYMKPFVMKLSE